ncbi:MAG: helix-turn-helix transcriptional regulator [Pseudonocardia sp.]|nr:helix-turn-helix transcriptional regulator [Pseudonocardia sp.]
MVTSGPPSRIELVLPDPAAAMFAVLGRRWSLHVMFLLGQRPARFTELQRAIPGISANSLNDRLRDLIDEGLVTRRAFPGPPMTSSYETTAAGQAIAQHLLAMPPTPSAMTSSS